RQVFFFNDAATNEIYILSLHDALPISLARLRSRSHDDRPRPADNRLRPGPAHALRAGADGPPGARGDAARVAARGSRTRTGGLPHARQPYRRDLCPGAVRGPGIDG